MEKELEKTIQAIKDYNSIPSVKEWNKIAKEHGFLTSISIKYIYGMSFIDICRKIRKD